MIMTMREVQIVDDFLIEYSRSPSKKEFVQLGGDIQKVVDEFGSYLEFLEYFGYDSPNKTKCYQVFDSKGKMIFEGSSADIARRFYIKNYQHIGRCARLGHKLNNKYAVKEKVIKL